jgi:hypothetical protein
MDTATLKENFENQLKSANEQITQLEADLEKAKEYRLKLQGGLETLALLNPESEEPTETTPTEVVE